MDVEPLPYFLYGIIVTRMPVGSTTLDGHFLFLYFHNLTIKTMPNYAFGILPTIIRQDSRVFAIFIIDMRLEVVSKAHMLHKIMILYRLFDSLPDSLFFMQTL